MYETAAAATRGAQMFVRRDPRPEPRATGSIKRRGRDCGTVAAALLSPTPPRDPESFYIYLRPYSACASGDLSTTFLFLSFFAPLHFHGRSRCTCIKLNATDDVFLSPVIITRGPPPPPRAGTSRAVTITHRPVLK